MIEFKAECGHTVRAKDEDAGKVVRCAYCGLEAHVPRHDAEDELDSLFAEAAARSGSQRPLGERGTPVRPESSAPRRSLFAGRLGKTDPFAIVTRMAWVTAVLVTVIFVGKKYAWPLIQDLTTEQPIAAAPTFLPPVSPDPPPAAPAARVMGLSAPRLDKRGKEGIHVQPFPGNAQVFYRECKSGTAVGNDDWVTQPAALRFDGPPYTKDLPPGKYEVAVSVALNDPELKRYRSFGYNEFRERVEHDPRRAEEASVKYFLPDGAKAVRVVSLRERLNVCRFYEVILGRDDWRVLTPLFLPVACGLSELYGLLPDRKLYDFDENNVSDELAYYRVAEPDRRYLVDILHRVGTISYRPAGATDVPYRLLKIHPLDGSFSLLELDDRP